MHVRFVDRSDPMMKTLLLTARYLPLPQPTSTPIEPWRCSLRNLSTSGQGCERIRVSKNNGRRIEERAPCIWWRKSVMLSVRTRNGHAALHMLQQFPCGGSQTGAEAKVSMLKGRREFDGA